MLIGLFLFVFVPISYGQSVLNKAKVSIFSKSEYAAGTQNWDIERDAFGRLFIANNEGLLVYNGIKWDLYPIPNKTIIRSLSFGLDGKLYAGAQDELGYYEADKSGKLVYTSLKKKIPASVSSFADVWHVEVVGNEVFFMSSEFIFRYANQTITFFKPKSKWTTLKKHHKKLIAQDAKGGIFVFQNNRWELLVNQTALPAGIQITDLKPFGKDTSLISTTKHGLFLLTKNSVIPFKIKSLINEKHFTTIDFINNTTFLVGTYNSGIYKIDKWGNVIGQISTKQGLTSNTIRCIYSGFDGFTWAGMDNSISLIDWNNSITHINPPSFNNGSGQSVAVFDKQLYFALSTGIQSININDKTDLGSVNLEPQILSDGLTWNLSVWQNQLFIGRDDGFWTIVKKQLIPITKSTGYWIFKPIKGSKPSKIACGNYFGVQLFTENNGQLKDIGNIDSFVESSRYLEVDSPYIWVSHPYHGLYQIELKNNSIKKYTQLKGLPSDLDNHVFKLKDKIVFATTKGIYEFDNKNNKIVPSPYYQKLLGKRPIRYLKEDLNGNIWFVQDKMLGVLDFQDSIPRIKFIPELFNHILSGFENMYFYNSENAIIGSDIGFYNINYKQYTAHSFPHSTYLSSIYVFGNGDSCLYGGYNNNLITKGKFISIPYKSNSLRFTFATTFIRKNSILEFSYYLEGYDKKWSNWGRLNEKDYTNLKEGNYVFHVKSRYGPSNEFKPLSFSFQIKAPWYRSIWAYLLYLIVFGLVIYLILKLQKRKLFLKEQKRMNETKLKFEEDQRQINYKYQLALEKKEKAIIQLMNDNLQSEVKHKSEDLASTAMNLLQKKAFLGKLTSELNKLIELNKDQVNTFEIRKIMRKLKSDEKLDEEWEKFSVHVKSVQNDFLITLKKAYPDLNSNELKLCAYLRMNLSSKEIAQLFSISVRGVEISRYRLRKKLKLQTHQDLFEFLMNFSNDDKNN